MLALRAVTALVLVLLGAVCAFAAVLVHADWWGTLLGWAVLLVLVVALPRGWHGRPAFALGWILALVTCLGTRPEGDFLIASDLSGYALLTTAPVLVLVAMVGLSRQPRRPRRSEDPAVVDTAS